ncbi:exonuclease domain-containing protein [Salinibacter ruber]|uniref:DNA polymerase III epsilon subunit-like protein n=1 Tax=Salinibacter ruber TaxID=146919 RepID=A0A9X2V6U1_9BACT|nr:DNA polymerase III epsilon subunit-like protein [Salinibacter ruber]
MSYLFFDTETTGLPEDKTAPITDTDNWPRIVQIAWCQVSISSDHTGDVESHIVRPVGFRIPREAESVHNISTEQASREGVPLSKVLKAFLGDVRGCEKLVAHNATFDKSVVGAEFVRTIGVDPLDSIPSICTMKRSEIFCGKSNYFGYRYPSLQELHDALFGKQFGNPHDASADAEAGAKCFFALLSEGIIEDTTAQHCTTPSLNIFSAKNKRMAESPF